MGPAEGTGGADREVGGWGRNPKKCTWRRLGDGVEYHLMKPTPRR